VLLEADVALAEQAIDDARIDGLHGELDEHALIMSACPWPVAIDRRTIMANCG